MTIDSVLLTARSIAKKCIGFHSSEKTIDYRDAFFC